MESLIGIAAQSFVSSASGNNCHVETWTQTNGLPRRWGGTLLDAREIGPGEGPGQDPPQPVKETMTMCNMGSFAGPQYYAQNWREAAGPGPAAYLDVEASFQVTPDPGGNLFCDFLTAAAEVIEAEYTPELLPEEQEADAEFSEFSNVLLIPRGILVSPFHTYLRALATDVLHNRYWMQ